MDKLCKIRDLQRAIASIEGQVEKEYGVSLNEAMTLCSLNRNEKLCAGEISEMLGLSCSNASKVIKSVEAKGYVKRILGRQDKRQMYFTLTKEGRTLIESLSCEKIEIPPILQSTFSIS